MPETRDFAFGFSIGAIFGASIAVFAAIVIAFASHMDWLYKWQTLVAGLLALLGAIATVAIINKQISQVDKLAAAARYRELLAARCMLPVTLSRICEYATQCVEVLKPFYVADEDAELVRGAFDAPPIPRDDLSSLQACIRHGDTELQNAIADLLSEIQVQSARLRGFSSAMREGGQLMHGHEVIEFVSDSLEIYARASNLFDYARRRNEVIGPSPSGEDMRNAAGIMDVRRPAFEAVYTLIDRRYPAPPEPAA